jgi:hypothetical protein
LKLAVKNGEVDYSYLVSRKNVLRSEIESFAGLDLKGKTKDEVMAFWINAYNLLTLDLILRHYPLKSIKDIRRDKRWFWKGWVISGKKVSLDEIEHQILRPMGDPRIHFAINCASVSCPVLSDKLYDGNDLDIQLTEATRVFLRDQMRGMTFKTRNSFLGFGEPITEVYISKLFNWFAEDFDVIPGGVLGFIRRYATDEMNIKLKGFESSDLRFLSYDWNLNGR